MDKIIVVFILIAIAILVIGLTVFYIYQLTVPYVEDNIIIDGRYMKNNIIRFGHNEVFKKTCDLGMSYTFWCYIDNWKYNYGKVKPVLTKGEEMKRNTNDVMLQTNKATPGIFLGNNSMNEDSDDPNKLGEEPAMLFTFREELSDDYNEVYELTNIPINKWFNIAVCIHPKDVELYMDGNLLKTIHFESNLDFNKYPLNVGELGGFDGSISKLAVMPYPISASEVYRRFLSGFSADDIEKTCTIELDDGSIEEAPTNDDVWNEIPFILDNDTPSADIKLQDSDVLAVYSQPNFNNSGGSKALLSVGNYSVKDLAELGIKPETISGVEFLKEGYLLTLYASNEPSPSDRKADYLVLRDTTDWNGPLRRMNNKVRSLKIERDPNKDDLMIELYENPLFSGWKLRMPIGKYTETDLRIHGLQTTTKFGSYKIDEDYQVSIFKKDFFDEQMNILRDENRNFGNLSSSILSMKIEPRTEEDIVACTFFEGKNYTGQSFKLSLGDYTMRDLIVKGVTYEDINSMFVLRSVIIPKGLDVLLYPRDEFLGVPQRLKETTSYIQSKLFHLSIIKSIKIVDEEAPKFSLKKILDNVVNMILNYGK
jgi:hypothetical protein